MGHVVSRWLISNDNQIEEGVSLPLEMSQIRLAHAELGLFDIISRLRNPPGTDLESKFVDDILKNHPVGACCAV